MESKNKFALVLIINLLIIVFIVIGLFAGRKSYFILAASFAGLLILLNILLLKVMKDKGRAVVELKNKISDLEKDLKNKSVQLKVQEDEILYQIRFLKDQGRQIERQKQEMEDSISYAFRIQQAILPPFYYIDRFLSDYFIFYLPKSIVSGDFYYFEQVKDYIIIAAVDCTGHGVPGAMMSVIGYDLLNQAVKINHLTKPSEILSFVDDGVTRFLRQQNDESGVHDGMDISVVCIHKFWGLVEFAGAYHELYYSHNGKIEEIKGDKLPIGVNFDGVVDQYTNHAIQVDKGDMLYLFSDGYADQFGGPDNKKFKYYRLKNLLAECSSKPALEQKEILAATFNQWKGDNEQIDDVLVMGIRV